MKVRYDVHAGWYRNGRGGSLAGFFIELDKKTIRGYGAESDWAFASCYQVVLYAWRLVCIDA
jgi:hypothetical protein